MVLPHATTAQLSINNKTKIIPPHQKRSRKTAIDMTVKLVTEIFCPPYTVEFIIKTVTNYLEYKKLEYKEGKIIVTPIYQ